MARLTIFMTQNVPPSLRGELSRWMLEVRAGVFVGSVSALVREKLWEKVMKRAKDGGATMIRARDNEQRFEILQAGDVDRTVVDFDGLQLVEVPIRPRPPKKPAKRAPAVLPAGEGGFAITTSGNVLEGAPVPQGPGTTRRKRGAAATSKQRDHDPPRHPDLGPAFIERCFHAFLERDQLRVETTARSNYHEIDDDQAWSKEWLVDIVRAANKVLELATGLRDAGSMGGEPVKIASLDIETTNYLPKAREGFVNVIGIATLVIPPAGSGGTCTFDLCQVFNMERKRDRVPALIRHAWPRLDGAGTLLVFNREFDVAILESVMRQEGGGLAWPPAIVDLQDDFQSLASLERAVERATGFKRLQTAKGKYDEYYAAFKGTGWKGTGKRLEPMGSYNAIDAITPLVQRLLGMGKGGG